MSLKNVALLKGGVLVAISSLGMGTGLFFFFEVPKFTFLEHAFRPRPLALAAATGLVGLTLLTFWLLYSRLVSRLLARSFEEVLGRDALTYLPLAFIALAPITLRHYLSAADILVRTRLILEAAVFLVIYLKAVQFREWRRFRTEARPAPLARLSGLSSKKKLAALFIGSLVFANLGSVIMLKKGIYFSGDEPHYLLMDYSLLHDGDLDLANNYAQKDYHAYMLTSGTIPQTHAVPGKKPGSQFSYHSPGTAFLLFPFYAAGSLFGKTGLILWLRFGMSLFGALFGLQVFLYVRDTWGSEKWALILWALTGLATPVYFHSIHIYPEIFIALFAFVVFRLFRSPAALTLGRLLLCGFLLSTFIWFHAQKYIFLAGPLFVFCLWMLYRKRAGGRDYAAFLVFPVVITAVYFLLQKAIYGSFSLLAVSYKGTPRAGETLAYARLLLTGIPFRFRWETLADYFFDQKDGLLLYAPIYFFSFLGLVEMARRKAGDLLALLLVTSPYVLVSAFLTQRPAYAPQARTLVAVIWVMIIGLGYFVAHNTKKIFAGAFALSSGVTLLVTWLLLRNPLAIYQETTVGNTERGGAIFYILSNLHFDLTGLLPVYIKSRKGAWPLNFYWMGGLAVFVLVYALARRPSRDLSFRWRTHVLFAAAGGTLFFIWFVIFPRTILSNPVSTAFPTGERLRFYSMSRIARQVEPGRFLLPEDGRAYVFSFTSRRKIRKLRFEFGSKAGDYDAGLTYFDLPLFEGRTSGEVRSLDLPSPPAYEYKNAYLYLVTLRLGKGAGVRTVENPYLFRLVPSD
jgi:hypothetical protein